MYKGQSWGRKLLAISLAGLMLSGNIQTAGSTVMARNLSSDTAIFDEESIFSGGVTSPGGLTSAITEEDQKGDDDKYYVMGRPMTQEEEEATLREIENYRENLVELPDIVSRAETEPWKESWEAYDKQQEAIAKRNPSLGLSSLESIEELPTEYSSVDEGFTPPVRGQDQNNCWAYASIGVVEISMIKNKIVQRDQVDLSESHLIYYIKRPVTDPLGGTMGDYDYPFEGTIYDYFNKGGTIGDSSGTLLNWMGPVKQDDFHDYNYLNAHHDLPSQTEGLDDVNNAYGNKAALVVETIEPGYDMEEMKRAIMEYGSLGIHYSSNQNYYKAEYASQYIPPGTNTPRDHAVVIVGWDDNFPKTHFRYTPAGNGAWLVRNSWGPTAQNKGHFWLSYYDTTMSTGRGYKAVSSEKYDNNYHYDRANSAITYQYAPERGKIEAVNVYTIQSEGEQLKAIQFGMQWSRMKYSIQVYKNPSNPSDPTSGEKLLEKPLEGTRRHIGIYTIDLERPITLNEGDRVAISVTYSSDNPTVTPAAQAETISEGRGNIRKGESFFRINDGEWKDCFDISAGNFIIKAFTSNAPKEDEPTHSHVWSDEWMYNDNGHWKTCVGIGTCDEGNVKDFTAHTGGEANCSRAAICTECGHTYGYPDPDNHVGVTERIGYIEPTATESGSTGSVTCKGCNVQLEKGEVIPPLGSDTQDPNLAGKVGNLDFTFMSIEDQEVSSKAISKPKMIVFFDKDDLSSQNTLELMTIGSGYPNVDVIAVEVGKDSKENVKGYYDTLGSGKNTITFCYDESNYAGEARVAYESAYNGITYMPLPVICYIDGDNDLKYVTSGTQNDTNITGNLTLYCGIKKQGLNKDNPSNATYKNLWGDTKGKDITMKAEGKPKVLVFFEANGAPSKSTMSDITSELFPGADVQGYLPLAGNEDNAVNQAGNLIRIANNLSICYHSSLMDEVIKYTTAGNISSISWPIICYIDAEDKLQHITTGASTLAEVKSNLASYCGWNPNGSGEEQQEYVDFTITAPTKKTYILGEKLDTAGLKITANGQDVDLQDVKITGFHSYKEGEKHIFVTYNGLRKPFKVLVVSLPGNLQGEVDSSLSQIVIPPNEYGTFSWNNQNETLKEGSHQYDATFMPTKQELYNTRTDIKLTVLAGEDIIVTPPVDPPVVPPVEPDIPEEKEVELTKPEKSVYLTGEALSLEGGKVGFKGEDKVSLQDTMVTGYDSNKTGIQNLEVTYKDKKTAFSILVVEKPGIQKASKGSKLSSIILPSYEYGTYSWKDGDILLENGGTGEYEAVFTPEDTLLYPVRDKIMVSVEVTDTETPIVPPEEEWVKVIFDYQGIGSAKPLETKVLKGGKVAEPDSPSHEDYIFEGWYHDKEGNIPWDFDNDIADEEMILYAKWTEKNQDGGEDSGETPGEGGGVSGNEPGDGDDSGDTPGGGDSGEIPGEGGDVSGNEPGGGDSGEIPGEGGDVSGNEPGDGEDSGEIPGDGGDVSGNEPGGEDSDDIPGDGDDVSDNTPDDGPNDLPITKDIIIKGIQDYVYNGKAHKPKVQLYDRGVLLKKNKDYKISYKNNININPDGMVAGKEYREGLPTVVIQGKGNYKGTLEINFNILPSLLDSDNAWAGNVRIQYSDNLAVNPKKAQLVFKSVKSGRTLKKGVDYIVTLEAAGALDAQGNILTGKLSDLKIPAGASGNFLLTITGTGNYSGTIKRIVSVAEKSVLMKQAKITLAKEYKNIDFKTFTETYKGELPGEAYQVRLGKAQLVEGTDYTVSYKNVAKEGNAVMVVTGIGKYSGTKTISFKLSGKVLKAQHISGIEEKSYTGKEVLQEKLQVQYEGSLLADGKDYTVSYTNNISKGTAAVTITALPGSGYQGSVKKTFKIQPAEMESLDISILKDISAEYEKSGAKPAADGLTNANGDRLVSGKDYKVTYKNNKQVADKSSDGGPVMILKGKGNYKGTLEIPFTITKASLHSDKIAIAAKSVAYNEKKQDSYEYRPVITVKDGNSKLSTKTDIVVEYENNTQAAYKAYYIDRTPGAPKPIVRITAKESGNYTGESILIDLPVYSVKLTSKNLYIVVNETLYTGESVEPVVKVYYDQKGNKATMKGISDEESLRQAGFVLLDSDEVSLTYGKNIMAGKNKGTVKVTGRGSVYGGNVTFKFNIEARSLDVAE